LPDRLCWHKSGEWGIVLVHVIRKNENDVNEMPVAVLVVAAGSCGEAQGIVAHTPLDELIASQALGCCGTPLDKGVEGNLKSSST
jgi:hypothetical protein